MIERITPPGVPTPRGPYSPAVRAGDFIYVSGQGPVDTSTNQMSLGDVQHETRLVLNNIKKILEGCGASMADVVKCSVFLDDRNDFAVFLGCLLYTAPSRVITRRRDVARAITFRRPYSTRVKFFRTSDGIPAPTTVEESTRVY